MPTVSEAHPPHLVLDVSYLIVFPFNELKLGIWLLLGICIGYDALEKHEDVMGLSKSCVRSAAVPTAGLRSLRAT